MTNNFKLTIFSIFIISLLIVAQQRIESRLTVSELEIRNSCEAGVLFYVLAYKEDLPLQIKKQQMHDMSMICKKYTETYKEMR